MLLGRYTQKFGLGGQALSSPFFNLNHLLQDVKRKMQYMLKCWFFALFIDRHSAISKSIFVCLTSSSAFGIIYI